MDFLRGTGHDGFCHFHDHILNVLHGSKILLSKYRFFFVSKIPKN